MRRTTVLSTALGLAALVALAPGGARAQGDEGEAPSATTSAVLLREAGATTAQSAIVSIGLRRGLREVENVRFVHPVDALSTPEYSQEVQSAIDELEPVADMVRTGDAAYAAERAAEIAALFEQNLERVRRSQLVDAYMLAAVGHCQAGERRECVRRIREIVAWREGLQYDAERYGPESEPLFEQAKARALSGARGTLVVETEPAGAEVYIDGRSYGPSPVRAEGLLAGHHYVTMKEIGHLERIVRAEVPPGRETVERYELEDNPEAQQVVSERAEAAIRSELGNERAGNAIRGLGNRLGTSQVIVGVLRPAAAGQVHAQLYLYHIHTRLLQAQTEVTLTTDEAGMERARQVATELYAGVDLTGGIEAPEDDTVIVEPQPEVYEQWWFWAAVIGGAALVGAGVGIGVAVGSEQQVPAGRIRFTGSF